MHAPGTVSEHIRKFIRSKSRVFTTADILNAIPDASRQLADHVTSQMVRQGEIRRVRRGLFHRARFHSELGQLPPSGNEIAVAVERSVGAPVIPAGPLALSALKLSTHVPARLEFKTPGPSRSVQFGNRSVRLRHAPPRRFRASKRIVPLVIEALDTLGRNGVTEKALETIRDVLGDSDRTALRHHIGDAPVWMQPHLRKIASE